MLASCEYASCEHLQVYLSHAIFQLPLKTRFCVVILNQSIDFACRCLSFIFIYMRDSEVWIKWNIFENVSVDFKTCHCRCRCVHRKTNEGQKAAVGSLKKSETTDLIWGNFLLRNAGVFRFSVPVSKVRASVLFWYLSHIRQYYITFPQVA